MLLAVTANYVIIHRIRVNKAKIEPLKKLRDQLEREKRLRQILFLSLGLKVSIYLFRRG